MEIKTLMYKLFVNRANDYAEAYFDKKSNSMNYKRVGMTLTEDTIQRHLEERKTIGNYLLKGEMVKCGCFDFDKNTKEDFENAKKTYKYLRKKGYHPLLEMSGGGEFKCHVWIFGKCKAQDMIYFLNEVCEEINIKPHEIFPKQEKTDEATPYGSFVKLPLGTHLKTDKKSILLYDDFKLIENPVEIKRKLKYHLDNLDLIPKYVIKDKIIKEFNSESKKPSEFDNFFNYVLSNELPKGKSVKESKYKKIVGVNDNVLKNFAVYLFQKGYSQEKMEQEIKPIYDEKKWNFNWLMGWFRKAESGVVDEISLGELRQWCEVYKPELLNLLPSGVSDLGIDTLDKSASKAWKVSYITSKELEEEEYNIEFLVDNFIIKGGVTMFSGAQASAKSILANYLAICVATGQPFFDIHKVEKGNVLIIDEENGRGRLRNRFVRLCKDMKVSLKDIDANFMIYQDIKMDDIRYRNVIKQYIVDKKPALIICDSMVRMMSGDEDKAKDVRKVHDTIKNLGAAFLLIHHQSKNVFGITGVRGSGDWTAMCDNNFILESHGRKGDNIFEIKHDKVRDAELVNKFKFKILDAVDEEGSKNLRILHLGDVSSEKEYKELAYKVKKWIEDNNIEKFKTGDIKKEFNLKHFYQWKPAKEILVSNNIIKEVKTGIFEVTKGGGFTQILDIK